MGFEASERVVELNARLEAFMDEYIYPREHEWDEWCLDQNNLWEVPPWYDELRELAKAEGGVTCCSVILERCSGSGR